MKATDPLEAPGCHDAKRAGQGHSKKLEWLASGHVGKPKRGSKIVAIIGGKGRRCHVVAWCTVVGYHTSLTPWSSPVRAGAKSFTLTICSFFSSLAAIVIF